jgi:hypothetical protein
MSIAALLNQTITIYIKSSCDEYGREVVGTGTDTRARVQRTNNNVIGPTGSVVTIEVLLYVGPDVVLNVDDRVTISGVDYKVFAKHAAIDGQGRTDHIKLELTKWKQI